MTLPPISEREFQAQIKELAQLCGWLVYHTLDSRGSDAGFPDLVLVRDGSIIFAELKSAKGRVTPAQQQWVDALRTITATLIDLLPTRTPVRVRVWRPADWPEIEALLTARRE